MGTESAAEAPDSLVVRRRFASHLQGQGIEIGPGHVPFPVSDEITVRYVDRWEPSVNEELFLELGDRPGFPQPDIVANLNEDRLSALADGSEDFVIASHVIEHMANPLAILVDCHRVLRPGGLLVLLVPDRHTTFDRDRSPTHLDHVIQEYRDDVREVDDAHILDFLEGTRRILSDTHEVHNLSDQVTGDEIELHRKRSVHVHVWNETEFREVLDYADNALGLHWEVVDTMSAGDGGTYGDEFGWVLRKTPQPTQKDGSKFGLRRRFGSLSRSVKLQV